jgi:hypothetical protein
MKNTCEKKDCFAGIETKAVGETINYVLASGSFI